MIKKLIERDHAYEAEGQCAVHRAIVFSLRRFVWPRS